MRRLTPVLTSLTAAVALIGGWTLAAALQPSGYDARVETISALASRGMPDRAVMTVALVLTGLAHVGTARFLRDAARAGRVVLALAGVATAAVAAVPLPSRHGTSAAHTAVATTSFVLLALWPVFASGASRGGLLRRTPAWATGVVLLLAVGTLGPLRPLLSPVGFGLLERLVSGLLVLWPVLVALTQASRSPRGRPRRHASGVTRMEP